MEPAESRVFRGRGIVVGAICVGFVHHCLYEVFDQLGPQLRWWAWNTDNKLNHPMLASVPMSSVFIFATLGPVIVTVLVMLLVGRNAQRDKHVGGWSLAGRIVVAGVLVPLGLAVLSIPSSVFGGDDPNVTGQAIVYAGELALVTVIALPVLAKQWRSARTGGVVAALLPNEFVRTFGPVYLGVLAALWMTALPAYFGAVNGVTDDGTPVGSLAYAVVSFVLAALAVVSVATTRAPEALAADGLALQN